MEMIQKGHSVPMTIFVLIADFNNLSVCISDLDGIHLKNRCLKHALFSNAQTR